MRFEYAVLVELVAGVRLLFLALCCSNFLLLACLLVCLLAADNPQGAACSAMGAIIEQSGEGMCLLRCSFPLAQFACLSQTFRVRFCSSVQWLCSTLRSDAVKCCMLMFPVQFDAVEPGRSIAFWFRSRYPELAFGFVQRAVNKLCPCYAVAFVHNANCPIECKLVLHALSLLFDLLQIFFLPFCHVLALQ